MIQPTDDRIVVELDELRDDVTTAGLIVKVSDTVESKRHLGKTGVVVAVGPGKRNSAGHRVPLVVNVGDRILFGEFERREHREDGKHYLIMQEADVCGVIE